MAVQAELVAPKIDPRSEFAGILKEHTAFGNPEGSGGGDRLNSWFDRLLIQSGTEMDGTVLMLLSVMGSIFLGGLAFVIQENLLTTAMGGMVGFVVPIAVLMFLKQRRQSMMLKQTPDMVDELARAARTGRSLHDCFRIVAEETPEPLGSELRTCSRRLRFGLGFEDALSSLPERTGLVALSVFSTALIIHEQIGGDLVEVLERLARTIRDRLTFLGRLKTMTTAGRATAILMLALPPAIFAFFVIRDPAYLNNLMAAEWGRRVTILAVVLDVVGSLWIVRVLKTSQRV